MIAVVQCLNCKALVRAWEKVGQWHKENYERVIYKCGCGRFTAVSVSTARTLEELLPTPSERRK